MAQANAPVVEKWERQRIRHVHRHKPVININQIQAEKLTTGERIADRFAEVMGSWSFIIISRSLLGGSRSTSSRTCTIGTPTRSSC